MKVIVIGAGLAGLSAAIHARAEGYEVQVVEKNPSPGGKLWQWRHAGFTFDMGPSMIIETWIIDEVLRLAGQEPLEFEAVSPMFSVWLEDRCWTMDAGPGAALEMVRRLAPEDAATFSRIARKMERVIADVRASLFKRPVKGLLGIMNPRLLRIAALIDPRLSASEYAARHFGNEVLRALLSTYPSYTEHPIRQSPAIAAFVPFLMLQDGIHYPKGGIYAIADRMYRGALEMGVEFAFQTEVERIETEGDRVVSVGDGYAADAFIATADFNHIQSLLGRASRKKAAHAYFAAAVAVDRRLPFTHHTFLIPRDYPAAHRLIDAGGVPREYPLYLCTASKTDGECAPEGCESLFIVGVLPSTQEHDWADKEQVFENALRQIERMTGETIRPAAKKILAPDDFESCFNNTGGSVFGLSGLHNPFVGFREYNADKRLRNLYYAGATVQPGNGVPLVIRSGKFAVDLLKRSR
ncbi:phytoene desaturase family protein [Imhoffiella purpurea]|uniref:Phytoene dehydrogenase-related protein n=1 Tax=Imhoffiella purpurea TaxID=1249627 RepID=W9V8B5_9GAMM|nr:phytoene desaturase family protein [Imhoffiella purpurea]EXJ15803.1 Phytoene dehydrogenase-related protein [Imhoffiella purpurea]